MTRPHAVPALVAFAAFAALAPPASGDETSSTEEHRALMISAQVMQKEGKLLRARDVLLTCSGRLCPDGEPAECNEIRSFCEKRLAQVEQDTPAVTFRVEDDRGLPIRADRIEVDTLAVDGARVVSLDPGAHAARAVYAWRSGETSFLLERGQKSTSVALRIDLRETVQTRPIPRPVYALALTTLAAGALALGTGIYTASSYQRLDACQPYCDASQRAALRTTGYIADVSTIVALGSLVAGAIWLFARPTVSEVRWLRPPAGAEGSAR